MSPVAEVRNLSAGYPGRPVLKHVNLAVNPGECLAIIGPNGSGKSTLLKCLARQLKPSDGEVRVEGENLWRQSPSWSARRIALSHSDIASEWPATVEHSVSLGRTPHRGWVLPLTQGDRTVIDRALERTRLTPLKNRPLDQLSDGERQRATLARSLAQEPRILLLDEPTANLDLKYQLDILNLTRSLAKDGMAVVATIHDLTLVARWADRVAMLSEGELAFIGPMREALTTQNIQKVYGVRSAVLDDPAYCTPVIVPLEVLP
ncbi:MAG: ABC transporter ATP-binding protein [Gemmataceae bacterium]